MVANSSVICRTAVTTFCIRTLLTMKADILSFLQQGGRFRCLNPDARSAHRVEARSERDFEPFGGDLVDEIACTADVDAESAAEPLPGLGHDVLVDPTAGGSAHRFDRDDRAVIGNLEIGHCGVSNRAQCPDDG